MTHSRISRLLSVLAAGALLTACVSSRDAKDELAVPQTVPVSGLSGLTLQVGDQKGGTEALLRAARRALPQKQRNPLSPV